MATENAPQSMYRAREGLGVWEHRGQVAAVGIGHGPTSRRWDGKADSSVGAISLLALRKAIEDAGVNPEDIDGLVMDELTTTGAFWPRDQELPWDVINHYNTNRRAARRHHATERRVDPQEHARTHRGPVHHVRPGLHVERHRGRRPGYRRGARAYLPRPQGLAQPARAATTRPVPTPRTPFRAPPRCARCGALPPVTARRSSSPSTAASTARTTT